MPTSAGEFTILLAAARRGEPVAEERLANLTYGQMRRLAARYMRAERPDHTLQPTALVNETYLRLLGREIADVNDRVHFFARAATIMRRILIDHARRKAAEVNGGKLRRVKGKSSWIPEPPQPSPDDRLLLLDDALRKLAVVAPRKSRVVEMIYFGGLTEKEVALVLGVADRTVRRDWVKARAWLHAQMREEPE